MWPFRPTILEERWSSSKAVLSLIMSHSEPVGDISETLGVPDEAGLLAKVESSLRFYESKPPVATFSDLN